MGVRTVKKFFTGSIGRRVTAICLSKNSEDGRGRSRAETIGPVDVDDGGRNGFRGVVAEVILRGTVAYSSPIGALPPSDNAIVAPYRAERNKCA